MYVGHIMMYHVVERHALFKYNVVVQHTYAICTHTIIFLGMFFTFAQNKYIIQPMIYDCETRCTATTLAFQGSTTFS